MKASSLILLGSFFLSSNLIAMDKSICGSVDSRVPSYDSKVARSLMHKGGKNACTATMISKSCAISAGHCSGYKLLEFNTPLSRNGWIVHSGEKDIYLRDKLYGSESVTVGMDWVVFSTRPNEVTKRFAGDAQGYYEVSFEAPAVGDELRITGHGMDRDPELNYAQQTDVGPLTRLNPKGRSLEHRVDTYGGNSGSSIINVATGKIVGIHTHGDCIDSDSFPRSSNMGTALAYNLKLREAIESCLADDLLKESLE